MNETRVLAKWLAELRYNDIPKEVVNFTKRFILDDLGCMLGGALQMGNKALMRDVLIQGEKSESTMVVYGYKTSAPSAALVNGSFIAGWDYDSTATGGGHMGSQTAAVLAMAEKELVDGKDIITAECAGIETQSRIGLTGGHGVITGSYENKYPWHSNTILGPFAAAVATGKILRFDVNMMENAIAIATQSLGGNYQHYYRLGSTMKRIRCGIGAWAGIRAALLAKEGLTGPKEALEGSKGFLESISGRTDNNIPNFNLDQLTKELGAKWYTLSYKSKGGACYCVSSLGSSLETTLELKRKYSIKVEDVESLTIEFVKQHGLEESNSVLGTDLGKTPVQRLGSSGWSARWMIAEAMVIGKPTIKEQLRNIRPYGRYKEIEEFSKKIDCKVNEEYFKELDKKSIYYPAQAGRVIIKLKNGKILDGQPLPYKGLSDARAENRHTLESLAIKLEEQATPAGISKIKQDRITSYINDLEDESNILPLISQLIR